VRRASRHSHAERFCGERPGAFVDPGLIFSAIRVTLQGEEDGRNTTSVVLTISAEERAVGGVCRTVIVSFAIGPTAIVRIV